MSTLREIKSLSKTIEQKNGEIQALRADADRCRHAAEAGSRSMDQLEQLRARKAEIQAIAFVEKKEAETESIDAEILRLEQGTAETLAQARAARLALIMIEGDPGDVQRPALAQTQVARTFNAPQASVTRLGLQPNLVSHPALVNKLLDAESVEVAPEPEPEEPRSRLGTALVEFAELEAQRRVLVTAWLDSRCAKAIDKYMEAFQVLRSSAAEAAMFDQVRGSVATTQATLRGTFLWKELVQIDVPAPLGWFQVPPGARPVYTIPWGSGHSDESRAQVLAELRAAGVVA